MDEVTLGSNCYTIVGNTTASSQFWIDLTFGLQHVGATIPQTPSEIETLHSAFAPKPGFRPSGTERNFYFFRLLRRRRKTMVISDHRACGFVLAVMQSSYRKTFPGRAGQHPLSIP
jgi:hypothetical protein